MALVPSFLVIDKAPGLTSHDVVAMVRAVTGIRKVGHTGTLDPFATGVLPLALGPATRLIQYLDESRKVYDATIALGRATDTGDPTGTTIRESPVPELDRDRVEQALRGFLGEQMQTPPRYSAVKVRGKRLYEYARAGEEVEAEARPITIHDLRLVSLGPAEMRVVITCSRGTYARVLADDIARSVGTTGHLGALVRRRSGPFTLDRALPLSRLSEIAAGDEDWQRCLRPARGEDRVPWRPREEVHRQLERHRYTPVEALPDLPLLPVSPAVATVLDRGGDPPAPPAGVRVGDRYLVTCEGELVALAVSRGGGKATARWRRPGS